MHSRLRQVTERPHVTVGTHLVSYADTDAGGVLHHAKYIELAERGRHSWLKKRKMSFRALSREHCLTLVVCEVSARYRKVVLLEDEIQVVTMLRRIDRTGLEWTTRILNGSKLSFSMRARMVCFDNNAKSIVPTPDFLIAKFEADTETT